MSGRLHARCFLNELRVVFRGKIAAQRKPRLSVYLFFSLVAFERIGAA
jgi:hypothetical protein